MLYVIVRFLLATTHFLLSLVRKVNVCSIDDRGLIPSRDFFFPLPLRPGTNTVSERRSNGSVKLARLKMCGSFLTSPRRFSSFIRNDRYNSFTGMK
jgi:hypothetical protein